MDLFLLFNYPFYYANEAMMLPLKAESSCKPCNPQRTPISAPAIAVSMSIEQVYLILRDYQQLVSIIGSAIGIADSEPIWNAYLGQWQVWVNNG
ncbi:hypothetical protein A4S05_14605 [Nostoc sp. KVJ20]|uniref:hypothetical protein n=1 Tax=unclassified Nostoc TaxID=2593658 RepID=UPI00083CF4EB|nr:hypothetical protein [Nostoc sp. KVJ20]ODG97246.1 hypothetical protein A4S05_14605 [Nostoc sp. KVJ20]